MLERKVLALPALENYGTKCFRNCWMWGHCRASDMTPQECLRRVGTGAWPVIRWPDVEKPVSEKNVKEHAPEPLEKGNESTEEEDEEVPVEAPLPEPVQKKAATPARKKVARMASSDGEKRGGAVQKGGGGLREASI